MKRNSSQASGQATAQKKAWVKIVYYLADESRILVLVLLDLKLAFDTVGHHFLLNCIEYYVFLNSIKILTHTWKGENILWM